MQKRSFVQRVGNRCWGTVKRRILFPARLGKTVSHSQALWSKAVVEDFVALRNRSLEYIASNHRPEVSIGGYAYLRDGPPLLYASAYAALARHLCGDLEKVSIGEKTAWVRYLQSFQSDDGLFRDPLIACDAAESCDWWGWRHLTLHVLMALSALGGVARQRFAVLEPFRSRSVLESWLEDRNWEGDPNNASNEVQNVGTLLQYARDFQAQRHWSDPVDWLLNWLAAHQDPQTGLWGPGFDTPVLLNQGVQTAYHLLLLFLYDRRSVGDPARIVRSCLNTQNRHGGFAPWLNSNACWDIDAIDPLTRFSSECPTQQSQIQACLSRALPWVLANANPDGGWVFKRHDPFTYGHPLMSTVGDQSAMFPTWFRLLSLAFCAQALPKHPLARLPWRFLECPGHQFWRT